MAVFGKMLSQGNTFTSLTLTLPMKAAKSEGSIFSAASDKDNIAFSVSFPFDSSSTDKDNIAASTAPTPFDLSSSLSLFDLLRNVTTIKTISKSVPANFTCPEDSKLDLISTVNYPSIGISGYKGNENKTYKVRSPIVISSETSTTN
ncbi:unnamed protein product [Brassica rapa subsp. trilocularis]